MTFSRVAVATPETLIGAPIENSDIISKYILEAHNVSADLLLTPELSLTCYTCGDLFFNADLLQQVDAGLEKLRVTSQAYSFPIVVGAPIKFADRLFNCAVILSKGEFVGVIPKITLPNTNEFYEARWFTSGKDITRMQVSIGCQENLVPFDSNLIFSDNARKFKFGVEICEDLWSVIPPSSYHALNGANIILNLSASNELVGKAKYRRSLVMNQSARCNSAYIYASCGTYESSTDTVYSGHCIIAENGTILKERQPFSKENFIYADIDLGILEHDRLKNSSFKQSQSQSEPFVIPNWKLNNIEAPSRDYTQYPFVPNDPKDRLETCKEIFNIQINGLRRRLSSVSENCKMVIGISGGLDSTLALGVCCGVARANGQSRKDIIAVGMPGFGTSELTKQNARDLAGGMGVQYIEIDICETVLSHFNDIGHDPKVTDLVFENAQARERTHILFDLANKYNGIVIGTGDLSEKVLGWSTFGGDQISMYDVNSGVPKTLVTSLVDYLAKEDVFVKAKSVVDSIL
ncbi:NAD(+) synthase, partial [bacterium]|nr:NAD(+) synthase [bacterium]